MRKTIATLSIAATIASGSVVTGCGAPSGNCSIKSLTIDPSSPYANQQIWGGGQRAELVMYCPRNVGRVQTQVAVGRNYTNQPQTLVKISNPVTHANNALVIIQSVEYICASTRNGGAWFQGVAGIHYVDQGNRLVTPMPRSRAYFDTPCV